MAPDASFLSTDDERRRYDRHDNNGAQYRRYLSQILTELAAVPLRRPTVLDFGSGPNRVLEDILRGEGISCVSYDPLYRIGEEHLSRQFDVVVAWEVLEHVRDLRVEVDRLAGLLGDGGWLIVSTQLVPDGMPFADWWYAADPTHVNFFAMASIRVVARQLKRTVVPGSAKGVFLFAPGAPNGAPG